MFAIIAERVYVFAVDDVSVQRLAGIEQRDFGIGRDIAAFAHEAVNRRLADAIDGEIVRDANWCVAGSSSQ